jgi:hypothetical protein
MRCALLNSTTELIEDFNRAIYPRIPGVREQYELAQRRYAYLQDRLLVGSDTGLVGTLLPSDTSMLDRSALYFALASSDTTRFIALFARPEEAGDHDEESVTVITDESDAESPNMYTYTIAGVRHQGKWYYEKTGATSFYASNLEDGRNQYLKVLMQQGYFLPDSTTPDPQYWVGGSFAAVGEIGWKADSTEENLQSIELREFAGVPLLVARRMKESQDSARDRFETGIRDSVVEPLFQKLHAGRKPYSGYDTLFWMKIIPNRDRSALLVPVDIYQHGDDSTLLAFWLLMPDKSGGYKAYLWNYFPPALVDADPGHNVVERISTLTRWNFVYYSIDDERFWSEYVMKREGAGYKYLVPLE